MEREDLHFWDYDGVPEHHRNPRSGDLLVPSEFRRKVFRNIPLGSYD